MQLKKLLQPTFNLTCQCWNIIIVLTQFSNNFVQKNIKNSVCMKLVKRETIFSKARCSSILCSDRRLMKFQHQKLRDTEAALWPVLKVISILWIPSSKIEFHCFINLKWTSVWSFQSDANRDSPRYLKSKGMIIVTVHLEIRKFQMPTTYQALLRNEMSCTFDFVKSGLWVRKEGVSYRPAQQFWPGYIICTTSAEGY